MTEVHEIIENGICEECEEPAVPYDDYTDYPYCAAHLLEMWTDAALTDFTEANPEELRCRLISRLNSRPISDSHQCYGMTCHEKGVSRLSRREYANATFDACAMHARSVWIPAYLINREAWVTDLAEEFTDNL